MPGFDDEQPPPAKVVQLTSKKPTAKDSFPATWVSEAVLKLDERPIVKGLIDPGAFVVIYGPPSSGKSFFTADLAQHIATGAPWRGRKVDKGLVVYVASEAGSSILKRFVAWRDNRSSELLGGIPLVILTRGPNLIAGTDIDKLLEQFRELQVQANLPLLLVVFDTLSRSMPGGDENNTEDMTMVIQAADRLREEFKCATAFVHHSGKNIDSGARGHSSLVAAADLVIQILPNQATVEKIRDGVAGERFGFSLEPVEIGTDSDGDPVLTCLFNESDARPVARREPTGNNQRIVIAALRKLIEAEGVTLPATSAVPAGCRAVMFDSLLETVLPKFPGQDRWRVKQRLCSSLLSLQASNYVGVHNNRLWLT